MQDKTNPIHTFINISMVRRNAFFCHDSFFLLIFDASKQSSNMRKIIISIAVMLSLSVVYSCQQRHSKVFGNLEKESAEIEEAIRVADSCDHLQMLSFSILGFRSDFEDAQRSQSLVDGESEALGNMADRLEKAWIDRANVLGCDDVWNEAYELRTSDTDDNEQ